MNQLKPPCAVITRLTSSSWQGQTGSSKSPGSGLLAGRRVTLLCESKDWLGGQSALIQTLLLPQRPFMTINTGVL